MSIQQIRRQLTPRQNNVIMHDRKVTRFNLYMGFRQILQQRSNFNQIGSPQYDRNSSLGVKCHVLRSLPLARICNCLFVFLSLRPRVEWVFFLQNNEALSSKVSVCRSPIVVHDSVTGTEVVLSCEGLNISVLHKKSKSSFLKQQCKFNRTRELGCRTTVKWV